MMMNAVAWFEIYVDDINRAAKFYETVLQTQLVDLPSPVEDGSVMKMFPGEPQHAGAAGSLVKMSDFKPGIGGTLVYFGSEDCANEESRVEAAGGKVMQSKFQIGEHGYIMLAMDTEGNMFGIHSQA